MAQTTRLVVLSNPTPAIHSSSPDAASPSPRGSSFRRRRRRTIPASSAAELLLRLPSPRPVRLLLSSPSSSWPCCALLRQSPQPRQPPSPPAVTLSTAPPRKRVAYEAFHARSVADKVKVEDALVANTQISAVLRDFGEGIMRLERRRMEVQWEIERCWNETETRSNRMLQDAQRQLQDILAAASAPGKKPRRDHGGSADGL